MTTQATCLHGFSVTGYTHTKAPDYERTVCCNAYTSIFIDTGTEYCKCCYATVTGI